MPALPRRRADARRPAARPGEEARPLPACRPASPLRRCDPGQCGATRQGRLLAEHGGGARERAGGVRESPEPGQRPAADHLRRPVEQRRGERVARPAAARGQIGKQLTQQKRVAARGRARRGDEPGPRLGEALAHDRPDARRREGRRPQHHGSGVIAQVAQQIVVRLGFIRARGHRERDRQLADPLREIQQKPQRRTVGPVRVADEDQQRTRLGQIDDRPIQCVQQVEQPLLAAGLPGGVPAQQQRPRAGRGTVEQVGPGSRGRHQQLTDHPERVITFQGRPGRLQQAAGRAVAGVAQQP